MREMSSGGWLHDYPPNNDCDSRPGGYCFDGRTPYERR
jgi:hypothetical protein